MKFLAKVCSIISGMFAAGFLAIGDRTGIVVSLVVAILIPLILLWRPGRKEIELIHPAPKRK